MNWYLGFLAVGLWFGAVLVYAGRHVAFRWTRKWPGKKTAKPPKA